MFNLKLYYFGWQGVEVKTLGIEHLKIQIYQQYPFRPGKLFPCVYLPTSVNIWEWLKDAITICTSAFQHSISCTYITSVIPRYRIEVFHWSESWYSANVFDNVNECKYYTISNHYTFIFSRHLAKNPSIYILKFTKGSKCL